MRLDLQFLIGCFGISTVITYAWWTKIRVWALRQDLFQIRDRLWDQMRVRGELDDPAHREFREGINSLIRLAPFLSLMTVARIVLDRDEFKPLLARNKDATAIQQARHDVFYRVTRYLLVESISGLVLSSIAIVFGMAEALKTRLAQRIEWLIDSKELQTLDDHLSIKGRGKLVEV